MTTLFILLVKHDELDFVTEQFKNSERIQGH